VDQGRNARGQGDQFDDDTFTDTSNLPKWRRSPRHGPARNDLSCNAKANVPYKTLKVRRTTVLRLLLWASNRATTDSSQHQEGLRTDIARASAAMPQARILVHAPHPRAARETKETIAKTISFAKEINPHTIQVSLRLPTRNPLYSRRGRRLAQENEAVNLVNDKGVQLAAISYPHLSKEEIFHSMEVLQEFYFRPNKNLGDRARDAVQLDMIERRLREGVEFLPFPARARGPT